MLFFKRSFDETDGKLHLPINASNLNSFGIETSFFHSSTPVFFYIFAANKKKRYAFRLWVSEWVKDKKVPVGASLLKTLCKANNLTAHSRIPCHGIKEENMLLSLMWINLEWRKNLAVF